jgi:hypothetical protein
MKPLMDRRLVESAIGLLPEWTDKRAQVAAKR